MSILDSDVMDDVLHHDDSGVDNDSEVDGAEGDEVCRGPAQHHAAERDQQSQRDIDRRDERGAIVAEEDDQDERHEQHPDEEVLDDRVRRQVDERAAVVERLDVHARRQQVIGADVLDAAVNALQRRQGLAAIAHQDRSLDDVRLFLLAHDAEPRHVAFADLRHIAQADRRPLLRGDGDVGDIGETLNQTDAAHRERLFAECEPLAANVLVGVGDGGVDLRQRDAECAKPVGVYLDVVLLSQTAEAHHVDDARNLLELPLQNPVLGRLQVLQRVSLPNDAIAEDLSDGVPWRDLGLQSVRELRELKAVDDLLPRIVVVGPPVEIALDVGEAEKRLRADVVEPRHARQRHLERDRNLALHFFRAQSLRLGDDFDQRGDGIRIGLDVEVAKGDDAAECNDHCQKQHENRLPQ